MSPTKIPTYRHEPLETWQLNGILRNLNMSEAELSRLTGAREKTIALWLDERATDRPPPHWLRGVPRPDERPGEPRPGA